MWTKDLFGTEKPIIGMLHLLPLPTDPKYDPSITMEKVVERARRELHALQDGGVDGFIFCNEFSIPYTYNVRPITIACMARVIGELRSEIKIPFGVDVAQDPFRGWDLAVAVGADMLRNFFSGAYAGDYGVMNVNAAEVERHRAGVGGQKIKTLAAIVPEGLKMLAPREIEDVAKTYTFSCAPDALLVYGNTAGSGIDTSYLTRTKAVVDTPVFASNGVNKNTVKDILDVADGAVVGTTFKKDGIFTNEVDVNRVKELMDIVKEYRGEK